MVSTKALESATEIGASCAAVRARILARTVTAAFDQVLKPFGVGVGQVNHLVVVARRGPLASVEVAKILSLEPSTASRNLERMRERGWTQSEPGADARAHQWRLTPKGEALLVRLLPAWREAQRDIDERLGRRLSGALATIQPGSPL